jgi:hypothetical protein
MIADAIEHYPDDIERVPWINDHYKNAYNKVQEYCEKIGVKCI